MEEKNKEHKFTYNDEAQNKIIDSTKDKFIFVNNEEENTNINIEQSVVDSNNEECKETTINKEEPNKKQTEMYIGFLPRLIINIILFVITISISICFIFQTINVNKEKTIKYQESSDIDYKVYLKENSFYEDKYLGKDMSYISTLIDNINTTFNYNFSIDQKISAEFKYNITGKLVIMDNTGANSFFEKVYVLLEDKTVSIKDSNRFIITENTNINYNYYNSIANEFKNKFGVSTTSNFIVTMNIKGESKDKNINIGKGQNMSITIPLSQREVKIQLSTNTNNKNEMVVIDSNIKIHNYWYLIISIVSVIMSIVLLLKLIKKIMMFNKTKSKYDKYIEKILKEYDRFIAKTKIGPIVNDGDKVIKLNNFEELLVVRDNLKVPINYYNIVTHQKSMFYLNKDNLIYEYCVKAVDLENNDIK